MFNTNSEVNMQVVVTGAGGFIGGWLVNDLISKGYKNIKAIDKKPLSKWYQLFDSVDNICTDLEDILMVREYLKGANIIYNLAADMGGMGFIEQNKAACMLSVLINTNVLKVAVEEKVSKYFYASSACVYNVKNQQEALNNGLSEEDAYPAFPEDGYGWEKLFSERMCRHFNEDFGLDVRVARFHNVYGPKGTFYGGREKAPAAICRKVAEAVLKNKREIEIWGDGEQTRSFTYIEDAIHGVHLLMQSKETQPLNIGSSNLISINDLVSLVEDVAGVKLKRNYLLDAPKGVRGRNSDNTKIRKLLNWEPSISLNYGIEKTYEWIYDQVKLSLRV